MLNQRTLTVGKRITVRLVFSLKRLDLTKEENMLFFACSEATESKLVKLETSRTVILPQRWLFAGLTFDWGQCDQIGLFWKVLPRIFLQNICNFLG